MGRASRTCVSDASHHRRLSEPWLWPKATTNWHHTHERTFSRSLPISCLGNLGLLSLVTDPRGQMLQWHSTSLLSLETLIFLLVCIPTAVFSPGWIHHPGNCLHVFSSFIKLSQGWEAMPLAALILMCLISDNVGGGIYPGLVGYSYNCFGEPSLLILCLLLCLTFVFWNRFSRSLGRLQMCYVTKAALSSWSSCLHSECWKYRCVPPWPTHLPISRAGLFGFFPVHL